MSDDCVGGSVYLMRVFLGQELYAEVARAGGSIRIQAVDQEALTNR